MKMNKRLLVSLLASITLAPIGITLVEHHDSTAAVAMAADTLSVEDIHGVVEVPVNPQVVVALDNRTFETLADWGVTLAAAPKDVMPANNPYVADESVVNLGNHREPNLELLAAAEPDLVIVGQRFASYYDEIKALVPNAAVLDFSWDVSNDDGSTGQNLLNGFKSSTLSLGAIFGHEAEAEALVADLDAALLAATEAYNGQDTILSVVVSGGEIGFSAPNSGRVWGPLYEIFGWEASLDLDNASSSHTGDDISVEAIAQSDPDWLMVLDRDAGVSSSEGATPATDVIENATALQNTNAIQSGNILYAPADTYTNESIQTYIELFELLAAAFAGQ